MNELQICLNSILRRLTDLLDKYSIVYWLSFGSTLGAKRHNGFIPWDDDIDIYIDGKDYNKMLDIFKNGPVNNLMLHCSDTISNYPFTFPKVIDTRTKLIENRYRCTTYVSGLYIDIFPLFSVSNNSFLRNLRSKIRYLNYSIVEAHFYNSSTETRKSYAFYSKILCFFSFKRAQERTKKEFVKGINKKKKYLMHPIRFNDKKIHKIENFASFEYLEFEGKKYKVPFDVDDYLTIQYGNYMELPPLDRRTSQHEYEYIEYSELLKDYEK